MVGLAHGRLHFKEQDKGFLPMRLIEKGSNFTPLLLRGEKRNLFIQGPGREIFLKREMVEGINLLPLPLSHRDKKTAAADEIAEDGLTLAPTLLLTQPFFLQPLGKNSLDLLPVHLDRPFLPNPAFLHGQGQGGQPVTEVLIVDVQILARQFQSLCPVKGNQVGLGNAFVQLHAAIGQTGATGMDEADHVEQHRDSAQPAQTLVGPNPVHEIVHPLHVDKSVRFVLAEPVDGEPFDLAGVEWCEEGGAKPGGVFPCYGVPGASRCHCHLLPKEKEVLGSPRRSLEVL